VVLLTQTNFKVFFKLGGWLVAARWNPTAKNIVSARSFNLSGPTKIRTISGTCHLYRCNQPCLAEEDKIAPAVLLPLQALKLNTRSSWTEM